MSDDVLCPACGQLTGFATRIGTLAICGACGASLNVGIDGTVRRAVAADTEMLSPRDRALLTKARSAIARPKVR